MRKKIITLALTALIAVGMCTPVLAGDPDSAGNVFEAGDTVTLNSLPFFGAFAAGQNVSVSDSQAEGSVMEAGQQVSISSTDIGESLYIAGNIVTCSDTAVHGNIYGAGNTVTVDAATKANGIYIVGSSLEIAGTSKAVYAAGGSITFSGKVDGDVYLEGDNVTVTDDAEVTGELNIKSAKDPEVSESAKIGSYSFDEVKPDENGVTNVSLGSRVWSKFSSWIYWVIAMGAFGMLLCWLFDGHLTRAAELIKERPGLMIGTGVVSWIGIPIIAILLCCSYILAPVGGLLMLAYVLLLCAGLAFAGASLVRLFLPNMNVFLSALIGIAVLEAVRMIPFIGFIVGMVADMYLLAYVIQSIWSGRKKMEAEAEIEIVPADDQM